MYLVVEPRAWPRTGKEASSLPCSPGTPSGMVLISVWGMAEGRGRSWVSLGNCHPQSIKVRHQVPIYVHSQVSITQPGADAYC